MALPQTPEQLEAAAKLLKKFMADPEAQKAFLEQQQRNRDVIANLLSETMAHGSGAILIDDDGTAHTVKDWQEK